MPTRDLSMFGQSRPASLTASLARIDADAAGPRAAAEVLLRLVAQGVERADAGQRLADVADLVLRHAAFAGQQGRPELGQVVAVGRGQPDAGDDDPLIVGQVVRGVGGHGGRRANGRRQTSEVTAGPSRVTSGERRSRSAMR